MRAKSAVLGLFRIFASIAACSMPFMFADTANATIACILVFGVFLVHYRLDIANVWIAFVLPWLLILGYSTLNISEYSRPISRDTLFTVVCVISIGLLLLPANRMPLISRLDLGLQVNSKIFILLLAVYLFFCVLNVGLAGYVPLLRSLGGEDSGYMDFGVKGIYGFFNAFANAFGLTAFYLWMTVGDRRIYKYSFFLVLAIFFIFVTRQNMISLMVESFVVFFLTRRRVSGFRVLLFVVIGLVCFALLGDLRTGGSIAELAAIKAEYAWMPNALVWLFAYCYFNILNLDNTVSVAPTPAFDGSSIAALLPSFLRPDYGDGQDLLEVSTFTVNSFISPLIYDVGLVGLLALFALFCLGVVGYSRCRRGGNIFIGTTGFAVLYFCFLFSFFVNFWFYLPVIFQLVFFWIFRRVLFIRKVF